MAFDETAQLSSIRFDSIVQDSSARQRSRIEEEEAC